MEAGAFGEVNNAQTTVQYPESDFVWLFLLAFIKKQIHLQNLNVLYNFFLFFSVPSLNLGTLSDKDNKLKNPIQDYEPKLSPPDTASTVRYVGRQLYGTVAHFYTW